ncbi:YslB family protein [Thalassobacillus devorans]|uniref:YslB family protein n=1 Tax=Thalassobacillus devorans TaxID=279813 RepID=UPI00048A75B5|nr:YslB family protein [Thalassobacillus devorans]
MRGNTTKINLDQLQSLVHTGAGYDLLRYYTLPDLLGKEAPFLLYYMGKNLARKSEMTTLDDIIQFFQQLGWGSLSILQEKKKETRFELSGHVLEKRLQNPLLEIDFRMEAGFLAEAITLTQNVNGECFEEIDEKKHRVTFTVMHT